MKNLKYSRPNTVSPIVYFFLLTTVVILGLGFGFALLCLLAWITCAVASGFGYVLPFWPVVGAWFLLGAIGRTLFGRKDN
jgi:hypothetical protein